MDDLPEGGPGGSTPLPPPPGTAGWYPDPWAPERQRYWSGSVWTLATTGGDAPAAPRAPARPPAPPATGGAGHPSTILPANTGPDAWSPQRPSSAAGLPRGPVVLALLVGLVIGVVGAALVLRSSKSSDPAPPDPAEVLAALVVAQADVAPALTVTPIAGGAGLSRPTLDLCNGMFPSESRRTARLQNAALDDLGEPALSTEAVLYTDGAATTQAFAELRAAAAACPTDAAGNPVGPSGLAMVLHRAPDRDWPQTAGVNRLAYDFTSDDGSGQPLHAVAVYLQRGRALLGVYFFQPDGPQAPVEGQTTVAGIVGVFAARLAALPTSAVGS